jgi:3-oxoacyl-[acyl-carrier protein] reductase
VLGHCESVDSGIMDTTVESFDRHFAVNSRAGWLLIREYVAARELSGLGITANCVDPGRTDNGWMTEQQKAELTTSIPLACLGVPRDAVNLIAFLCSPDGGGN